MYDPLNLQARSSNVILSVFVYLEQEIAAGHIIQKINIRKFTQKFNVLTYQHFVQNSNTKYYFLKTISMYTYYNIKSYNNCITVSITVIKYI